MNGVLVKIWVGVLLLAVGGYGAYTALRASGYFAAEPQPTEESPKVVELKPGEALLPQLADVKLVERSGANFRWSQLEGQPFVANVFFSNCMKECSILSAQIAYLQRAVPDVRFVSITCDPDRDTLPTLQRYAEQYQAAPGRWFFLTGDMRDIQRATTVLFGFPTKRIDHSPYLALMDADG
jgi:protein SCO1/2